MVRITVIWLSVKYQNFFSFQNVTYAYPPHTVNVPFISSHIKVSRSSFDASISKIVLDTNFQSISFK